MDTDRAKDWIEDIADRVYQYYNCRKIVLWGSYSVSDSIRERLREKYGLPVAFYVDGDSIKVDNDTVFAPDCLRGKSQEYYVVIPLAFYRSLRDKLIEYGYQKDQDYYYFCDCIVCQISDYYEDSHGNKITGHYDGLKFAFSDFDSAIVIGKDVRFRKSRIYVHSGTEIVIGDRSGLEESEICAGSRGKVTIEKECTLLHLKIEAKEETEVLLEEGSRIAKADWRLEEGAVLKIGRKGFFYPGGILFMNEGALLEIGSNFDVGRAYNFFVYSTVMIGDNCLFADNVDLRTNDGHSIFDLKTGENINSTCEITKSRKIVIGNHVWIGLRAIILYNTEIGEGSIIGAGSLVKSRIPDHCIAAGVPARVIKKDVTWCHKNGVENIRQCGEDML